MRPGAVSCPRPSGCFQSPTGTPCGTPHPEVLQVLDPRPLLDDAAAIAARYGGTGLLIAETLAAGLAYGGLYFGTRQNVGRVVARAAADLDRRRCPGVGSATVREKSVRCREMSEANDNHGK